MLNRVCSVLINLTVLSVLVIATVATGCSSGSGSTTGTNGGAISTGGTFSTGGTTSAGGSTGGGTTGGTSGGGTGGAGGSSNTGGTSGSTSPAPTTGLSLFFSDLTSGPNSGGQSGKGAYVTVFGNGFGDTQGASTVTIGGGTADNYPIWTKTKITFQLGGSAKTGDVVVHVVGKGDSNALPTAVSQIPGRRFPRRRTRSWRGTSPTSARVPATPSRRPWRIPHRPIAAPSA